MDIPDEYQRLLRVPASQMTTLAADQPITASSLDHAILFVLARWSGSSQTSFRALNDVLADYIKIGLAMPLYIADTDSAMTQEFFRTAGIVPVGYGETLWIREGVIIGTLRRCSAEAIADIRALTSAVLA